MILHRKCKNNILKSLVMMDKYNYSAFNPWFAHNKINMKNLCSAIPEGYFRISLNCCDMH